MQEEIDALKKQVALLEERFEKLKKSTLDLATLCSETCKKIDLLNIGKN